MADAGVVALDPVRLTGLEASLDGLVQGCRRGAADVESHLAGTGASAGREVDELHRVADWCRIQADGVARRRRIIEALPTELPRPRLVFASPSDALDAADLTAERLLLALEASPPPWPALVGLLDEVRRGQGSPAYRRRLLARLGPEVLLALPTTIDLSHRASEAGPGASGDDVVALAGAQRIVVELCAGASPPVLAPAPTALLWRAVAGMGMEVDEATVDEVGRAAQDAGLAADVVVNVIHALRALASAPSPAGRVGPLRVAGLLIDLAAVADDPGAKEVLSLVSGALSTAATVSGAAAPVLLAGAATAALIGFLWGKPLDLDDDDRDERHRDPATGESHYPSGSASNPNGDLAGNVLDPRYA